MCLHITEHLTKTKKNLNLLKETRAVVGFTNAWTSQTKVFANLEGDVHVIKNCKDLEKLSEKCAIAFPEGLPPQYKAPRKDNGRKRSTDRRHFSQQPPPNFTNDAQPPLLCQQPPPPGLGAPGRGYQTNNAGPSWASTQPVNSNRYPESHNSLNYVHYNTQPSFS